MLCSGLGQQPSGGLFPGPVQRGRQGVQRPGQPLRGGRLQVILTAVIFVSFT